MKVGIPISYGELGTTLLCTKVEYLWNTLLPTTISIGNVGRYSGFHSSLAYWLGEHINEQLISAGGRNRTISMFPVLINLL